MSQLCKCYSEYRYVKCRYAECHHAKCHYAKCHYAKCHHAKCHHAMCHNAKCHYVECRYTECRGAVYLPRSLVTKKIMFLNISARGLMALSSSSPQFLFSLEILTRQVVILFKGIRLG